MHALAALSCLSFAALGACDAHAQSNQAPAAQQRVAHGPTARSVFALAQRLVQAAEVDSSRAPDEIKNEALRLPLRNQLALSIRRAGLEAAFGDYVAKATSAWEFWDPQRDTPARQLARQIRAMELMAKMMLVAGDAQGAAALLARRYCLGGSSSSSDFVFGFCVPADELMLGWELESGKLAAAARRLRETHWRYGNEVFLAERVARSFIAAGRASEAYDILAELWSKRLVSQAAIAEAYWRLGAVEEGRRRMRELVGAALEEAKRDPTKSPPVALAGTLAAMGDRADAIETLTDIRKFDAKRLAPLRAALAGRLALAGLDADASALLSGTPADRDVLSNIVVGQARRGDFAAAFATLQTLQAFPSQDVEHKILDPTLKIAIVAIIANAARAGDTEAFSRADAMRRAFKPAVQLVMGADTRIVRDDVDPGWLGELARAGKADFAVDYALALPDLADRLAGLEFIAGALAGLPNPRDNRLAFYDPI